MRHLSVLKVTEWIARQLVVACGLEETPGNLIRDRDQVYGERASRQARALNIREVVSAPRSPWQNAYAERVVGSIRRECLDHMVVIGERHLKRAAVGLRALLQHDSDTLIAGQGRACSLEARAGWWRCHAETSWTNADPQGNEENAECGVCGDDQGLADQPAQSGRADQRAETAVVPDLIGKQIQLLKEVAPRASRIGVISLGGPALRHQVRVPTIPMYLNAVIASQDLVGGSDRGSAPYQLRVIGVMGFPMESVPEAWVS